MDCLVKLVKCKFLKNINEELSKARTMLTKKSKQDAPEVGYKPATRKEAKKLYNYYMYHCGFVDACDSIDVNDKDLSYYLQDDHIVWIACRQKHIVDQIKLDSALTNGDVPLYSGKQYIQNKLYYVAMFDLTFYVPPITTN